jgi:hypothetical protein
MTDELSGLTEAEKRALLALLQEQERRRAEKPIDTRPTLQSMMEEALVAEAARCEDPAVFLRAHAEHDASFDRHYEAVWPEHDPGPEAEIGVLVAAFSTAWHEAMKLAAADGHPVPRWQDYCKKQLAEPVDDPGTSHCAAEPLATRQRSQASLRRPEHAPAELARDPLRLFRNQNPELEVGQPEWYEDR